MKILRRFWNRVPVVYRKNRDNKGLSKEGIPSQPLAAPIIPGLNDTDILLLAKKVSEAGARRLGPYCSQIKW